MKRLWETGIALFVAASLCSAANPAMSVKEIMGKLNKGPKAMTLAIKRALQAPSPSWDEIQKETQEYANLVKALGQAEPPTGDKSSWEKLTSEYVASATALDQAVQKKDKSAALAAHGKITRSCLNCHKAHRQ